MFDYEDYVFGFFDLDCKFFKGRGGILFIFLLVSVFIYGAGFLGYLNWGNWKGMFGRDDVSSLFSGK